MDLIAPAVNYHQVCGCQLRLHFDGYLNGCDFWTNAGSPNVHPVGRCKTTDHNLHVPKAAKCCLAWSPGVQRGRDSQTVSVDGVTGKLMQRLRLQDAAAGPYAWPVGRCQDKWRRSDSTASELRYYQGLRGTACKPEEGPPDNHSAEWTQWALHQSVFMTSMAAHPLRDLPLSREQHRRLLPGVADVEASQVARWTVDEVAEFVQSLLGCEEHAKSFRKEQIDGKAFLLLTQVDIVKVMKIKLGPALKIYNSILMFRSSQDLAEDDAASGQETKG